MNEIMDVALRTLSGRSFQILEVGVDFFLVSIVEEPVLYCQDSNIYIPEQEAEQQMEYFCQHFNYFDSCQHLANYGRSKHSTYQ